MNIQMNQIYPMYLTPFQECLSLLNAMIKANRQSPDLYVMRARLHQVANRITVAYYDVREALKLQHDHRVSQWTAFYFT